MSLKTETVINNELPKDLFPLYHSYIEQFKDHPEIAKRISNVLLTTLKKVNNVEKQVRSGKWPIAAKESKLTKNPMAKYYYNQLKHFNSLKKKYRQYLFIAHNRFTK